MTSSVLKLIIESIKRYVKRDQKDFIECLLTPEELTFIVKLAKNHGLTPLYLMRVSFSLYHSKTQEAYLLASNVLFDTFSKPLAGHELEALKIYDVDEQIKYLIYNQKDMFDIDKVETLLNNPDFGSLTSKEKKGVLYALLGDIMFVKLDNENFTSLEYERYQEQTVNYFLEHLPFIKEKFSCSFIFQKVFYSLLLHINRFDTPFYKSDEIFNQLEIFIKETPDEIKIDSKPAVDVVITDIMKGITDLLINIVKDIFNKEREKQTLAILTNIRRIISLICSHRKIEQEIIWKLSPIFSLVLATDHKPYIEFAFSFFKEFYSKKIFNDVCEIEFIHYFRLYGIDTKVFFKEIDYKPLDTQVIAEIEKHVCHNIMFEYSKFLTYIIPLEIPKKHFVNKGLNFILLYKHILLSKIYSVDKENQVKEFFLQSLKAVLDDEKNAVVELFFKFLFILLKNEKFFVLDDIYNSIASSLMRSTIEIKLKVEHLCTFFNKFDEKITQYRVTNIKEEVAQSNYRHHFLHLLIKLNEYVHKLIPANDTMTYPFLCKNYSQWLMKLSLQRMKELAREDTEGNSNLKKMTNSLQEPHLYIAMIGVYNKIFINMLDKREAGDYKKSDFELLDISIEIYKYFYAEGTEDDRKRLDGMMLSSIKNLEKVVKCLYVSELSKYLHDNYLKAKGSFEPWKNPNRKLHR